MNNTSNNPKITVVTVVYNAVKTIEQTIKSVLNQNYKNIEYIIIDGSSTDGTLDIIKKYESEILFISEPDNGIYDAMNKGIKIAKGEWIYFIGSDDILFNANVLSTFAEYLYEDFDIFSGYVYYVNEYSKLQYIYGNNIENSVEDDCRKFTIKAHHQGMIVKTSVMKKHLFDKNYYIAADYKWLLDVWFSKRYRIKKTKDILAYFSDNGVSRLELRSRLKEQNIVIREINERYSQNIRIENEIFTFLKMKLKETLLAKFIKNKIRKEIIHECDWDFCRWCRNEK